MRLDEYLPMTEREGYTVIVENRDYAVFDGAESRMGPAGHMMALAMTYVSLASENSIKT